MDYEYEYKSNFTTTKISLKNGTFSCENRNISVPFSNIIKFGFGVRGLGNNDPDISITPDRLPQEAGFMVITYTDPKSLKKKHTYIIIDLNEPICKDMINQFFRYNKDKYVGAGNADKLKKKLEIKNSSCLTSCVIIIAFFLISFGSVALIELFK
ncbi:hypothetical protein GF354_02915 [Candidatus Peregrinibacteria bacterium]|nr:hypothetical protein [Candidatus Peregrinibacteria bacterium]